jgi:hypothetical protein
VGHFKAIRVLKLEVKFAVDVWQRYFGDLLDECLTKTDAHATEERTEREWVPFLAARSQVEWGISAEALRDKLVWQLPLVRIVAKRSDSNKDRVIFPDLKTTRHNVFHHPDTTAVVDWRLDSHSFVETLRVKIKLRVFFVNLSLHLRFGFRVFAKMQN